MKVFPPTCSDRFVRLKKKCVIWFIKKYLYMFIFYMFSYIDMNPKYSFIIIIHSNNKYILYDGIEIFSTDYKVIPCYVHCTLYTYMQYCTMVLRMSLYSNCRAFNLSKPLCLNHWNALNKIRQLFHVSVSWCNRF